MNYTIFVPTFILFFRKFTYFPPSISFKKLNTLLSNKHILLLNNFSNTQNRLSYFKQYRKLESLHWYLWMVINEFTITLIDKLELTPLHSFNTLFNPYNLVFQFISNIKFTFSFFCERLNKKLYKYSNYKRPRFSLKFYYVPKYRRFRTIFKLINKTIIFEKGNSYMQKIFHFWNQFFSDVSSLYFYRYLWFIQYKLLKLPRKSRS
uniref:Uncharacterized protein n=1 Tax=Euplotes vanleeuwenhoeki TaxID=2794224 RepID=A0A7T1C5A8_9SPIT|nr:hypothetical protein KQ443_mgp11 [Euplotes vanleeuwenhoeki]QPM99267.1 hypothetical protein MitoLV_40 [Euplotes vanleeuwenhoeki]